MKKTLIFIAVVLLVSMIGVFTLSSCNLQKILENADMTEDGTATDKEGCIALIDAFFEETLTDPDVVVTCKNKDGEVQFTDTVKGTDSLTVGRDGSKTYAFKKGDIYYWASITQDTDEDGEVVESRFYYCSDPTKSSYYVDMDSVYKTSYCQFMGNINLVSMLPEKDSTFRCESHAEKTNGVTTGSLTFSFTTTGGTFTITASSEENLVKTVHIVLDDKTNPQASRDQTLTFVYGAASITLPDIDAWEREEAAKAERLEANEQAIESRDELLTSALFADNVKITVTDYLTFATLLSETIANDIDCVDYGTYKTYAYMVEVDEENADYFLVTDGEEKTYTKNSDDYGDNWYVCYSSYISVKDSLAETAEFTYEVREDGYVTYNVKVDGNVIYAISVDGNQDAITQVAISGIDDNGDRFMIGITLEYNTAELQQPDLSNYVLVS